jgi:UDP-N-acetylmuramoylalanine--D-glutamate ligase
MIQPEQFKGKKIIVFGLGSTGCSVVRNLFNLDVKCIFAVDDDKKKINRVCESVVEFNVKINEGKLKILSSDVAVDILKFDEIFALIPSPGIPSQDDENAHVVVKKARKCGVQIVSDLELFYMHIRYAGSVLLAGITGSNGKSTTTSLAEFLLIRTYEQNNVRRVVRAAGNIGMPVLDLPLLEEVSENTLSPIYLLELSSFQLDALYKKDFNLDVSVCLNISIDHLERYGSVENYAASKKKIFSFCRGVQSFKIISVDYVDSRAIYDKIVLEEGFDPVKGVIPFSTIRTLKSGLSLIDGVLEVKNVFGIRYKRFDIRQCIPLSLQGRHNAENIVAAFATCIALDGSLLLEDLINILPEFCGLAHRAQFVGEIGDLIFVNDSKATNVASTINSLERFKDIHWIVGGKSKGEPLNDLCNNLHNVCKAYLVGETQNEMKAFCNYMGVEFVVCDTIDNALMWIKKDSLDKGTILLSPAHSSLDQWENFEERGNYFIYKVKKLWKVL